MMRKIMSKKLSKGLSLLLVLCMMITLLPAEAMAAELGTEPALTTALEDGDDSDVVSKAPEETPVPEETAALQEETPAVETDGPASEIPAATEVPAEEMPEKTGESTEKAPVSTENPAEEEPTVTDEPVVTDEPAAEVPATAAALNLQDPEDDEIAPQSQEVSLSNVEKSKNVPLNTETFYKIFHLDCGRKYFSVDQIKAIIDMIAANDYNTLELAVGNDGLRFLLNDLSLTVDDTTYSSNEVKAAIQAGNKGYYDAGTNELTEAEMDTIFAYAQEQGIAIIPLINTPGHMDAILSAATALTGKDCAYDGSERTIDVTNATAVNFTLALVDKYIQYFANKDCKIFNMGCDEYANDKYSTGSMGFGQLVSDRAYGYFVTYVNNMAAQVQNAGMTPLAFNDGIYFNSKTDAGTFDSNIAVAYWSSGWNGYTPAPASFLAEQGHKIINTNGDWYYVLGNSDINKVKSNINKILYNWVMGSGEMDVAGCMAAFWCDDPEKPYDETAVSDMTSQITTFAKANPAMFSLATTDSGVEVTAKETINIVAGGSVTRTIEGADYTGNVDRTELNKTVARVSVETKSGTTVDSYNSVSSITSGKQYLITLNDQYAVNQTVSNRNNWGINALGIEEVSISAGMDLSSYLWTITENTDGSYYVQAVDGTYLNIGSRNANATVTLSSTPVKCKVASTGSGFAIYNVNGDHGLNNAGGANTTALGWATGTGWTLYEYAPASSESIVVTFTAAANAAGQTTHVTVGNTRYTINVLSEDLGNVTPLTVEYWITNGKSTDSAGNNSLAIAATAAGVYSEDGAAINLLVPENTTKESRTLQYWRCRLLDTTKLNSSKSGTEEQTEDPGDDETYNGVEFTRVRYYNGEWSVYTENGEWVAVIDKYQLVAYYLEILPVADELIVSAADWGKKGDGSTSGDYLDPKSSCTVSIQVVYEDGSTNPASTTAADLKSSTIAYGYWENGRGVGTLNLTGLEGYQIWKIEAETGGHTYANSSSTWGSYTVTNFTWDNNPMTVYEGDPVDSYVIHNDANSPSSDGYYANLMWDENYESILIKVYVKAKPTDETLKVIYYDETFGAELYAYDINVASGRDFTDITPTPGAFTENAERIDVTDCRIENVLGVYQTFQTQLTDVPQAVGKYNNNLYEYTGSEISEDNRTLYLYYKVNTETFSPVFVVDFGLPLTFELEKVVPNQTDQVTSVSVNSNTRYGTLAYDAAQKTFTYTPTKTLSNIDVLTINIMFAGSSTATISNVGVMPATTVYYEEGFADLTGFSGGSKGGGTQATQIAGESKDEYGFDAKYESEENGPSNGTQAISNAKGDKATFAFTGTGLDIYTNNTPNTGLLLVQLKNSSGGTVKLTQVNTAMVNGKEMEDGTTNVTDGQEVDGYNVPVVSLTGLARGAYTVALTNFDGKTINLDGFRVYGTLADQNNEAYRNDNEDNPVFIELRDRVLASLNATKDSSEQYANQIARNIHSQVYATADTTEGAVITVVSGSYTNEQLTDLLDNGPKNEIYLLSDQAVTFKLTTNREVQVGLKALNAATSYSINSGERKALSTSTDMFYTVLSPAETAKEQAITITNHGDGILAITKVKVCDDPAVAFASLTAEDLIPALESLGIEAEPDTEEPDEPAYADAVLNVAVTDADGKELAAATLTANGAEGESAVFAAADIQAAVEALELPEDYKLEDASYGDVTVAYGETGSVSFKAVKEEVIEPTPTPDPEPEPAPVPDEPTSIIGKIFKTVKNIFDKIFRW